MSRSGDTGLIVVTRRIPQAGMELLEAAPADGVPFRIEVVQTVEDRGLTRPQMLDAARRADVLLSQLTEPIDREILAANPALRGVSQMAVGYDNIDVQAATALGLPVTNTPGVLTETTADLTWALLLAVARRIPEAERYLLGGRYKLWGPNLLLGHDVSPGGSGRRKILGIVGYGRIGRAVARRSLGFQMDVLAYDPLDRAGVEDDEIATWAELDELLARSDFVSLHPALTEDTRHLIGAAELATMKPTACLINVSRGPVVDEAALVEALESGTIGGAALDVFEDEPELAPGLAACAERDGGPPTLLVPHIGSASRDTRDLMASMAATNALAHLRGERAPDCVNPAVYDTDAYRARIAKST